MLTLGLVIFGVARAAHFEPYHSTDIDINIHGEDPVSVKWTYFESQCGPECFTASDKSCNAVLFDEATGRCDEYNLSGFYNKIMRLDSYAMGEKVPEHSMWKFQYAKEAPGWTLVLKRVFGDIEFSCESL